MLGRNVAMMPNRGRSVLVLKMNSMLVWSASQPKNAEPMPPRPNISPKKRPEIMPTLSGFRSVAYTSMAEKAEAMTRPTMMAMAMVQYRLRYGSASVKGAAPRMEKSMTYFRP